MERTLIDKLSTWARETIGLDIQDQTFWQRLSQYETGIDLYRYMLENSEVPVKEIRTIVQFLLIGDKFIDNSLERATRAHVHRLEDDGVLSITSKPLLKQDMYHGELVNDQPIAIKLQKLKNGPSDWSIYQWKLKQESAREEEPIAPEEEQILDDLYRNFDWDSLHSL